MDVTFQLHFSHHNVCKKLWHQGSKVFSPHLPWAPFWKEPGSSGGQGHTCNGYDTGMSPQGRCDCVCWWGKVAQGSWGCSWERGEAAAEPKVDGRGGRKSKRTKERSFRSRMSVGSGSLTLGGRGGTRGRSREPGSVRCPLLDIHPGTSFLAQPGQLPPIRKSVGRFFLVSHPVRKEACTSPQSLPLCLSGKEPGFMTEHCPLVLWR